MSLVNDRSGGGRTACLPTTSMMNKNYRRKFSKTSLALFSAGFLFHK